MKLYEALADAFASEGVAAIFGLMGDGNMYWWSAMRGRHPDVAFHQVRHEGAGLAMAEGWARMTGRVGVCAVTMGPGLTQLATALVVAAKNQIPIVVFAGDAEGDENEQQYLDQRRFSEASAAGFVGVRSMEEALAAVSTAFYRARVESRPIVLNVPLRLQLAEFDGDLDDHRPSSALLTVAQRGRPDPDRLAEAADMLSSSQKPVILVGRGAVVSGAGDAVVELAKHTGALIATTLPARGWLADQEYNAGIAGLFATRTAMSLFEEADCVLGIGVSFSAHTLEGGYIFPNARFVQIDVRSPFLMGTGRRADCFIQGDACATTEALHALLVAKTTAPATRYRTEAVRTALRSVVADPRQIEIEAGTVDPRALSRVLDERLPAEVGIVFGIGHFWHAAIFAMTKPRPVQLFLNGFGSIGQALPTAIGASIAAARPMIVIEGDASAMMHIQELDTAARARTRLLVVVYNDQMLGAEFHRLGPRGVDPSAAIIPTPDLGAVARAFGIGGRLATTLDEVTAAVDEFLNGSGSMLIDVRVSRDVVSVPYRRLFGEDI